MPWSIQPPEINRRAKDPPHVQVADWLRALIEAGEFRPGIDPLPSESDLVDLLGIARDTARRAVGVLRDEGLVETVRARGTYVLPPGKRGKTR
jgi:DNA-binding GntR family transcriptional regulator